MSGFADLELIPPLLRAVEEQGYTEPTPIQAQAIPLVLAGRDVMGGAQTGTGKTASFVLPILQRLSRHANTSASPARHPVRALILTPTRELAVQVHESVQLYGKFLPLRSTVVYGGMPMDPQTQALRAGVEILVATPGRLLDHVQQKTLSFPSVEAFVLDEADRMLDMGFVPDVRRIISLLPKQRQNLLFSATFSNEIKSLADTMLTDPVMVQVARQNATATTITHVIHPVPREKKRDLLAHLLRTRNMTQVLVFCGTRLGANRLAYQLQRDGIQAAAIHGDKTQTERTQALDDFKSGKAAVLVATDVAARGLDIEGLPYVVNFELPQSPEDYVHRIGRTGRAGALGRAVSLVCSEELERLEAIEKMIKMTPEREIIPGFGTDAGTAAAMDADSRPAGGRGGRPERGADRGSERGGDRGGERGRDRGGERGADRGRDRPSREDRGSLTGAPAAARPAPSRPAASRSSDPIFSQPYQPSTSAPAPAGSGSGGYGTGPRRQVAALLGGIPKARDKQG